MTASASLVAAASTSPYLACSTAASARSPRVRWTSTPPTSDADCGREARVTGSADLWSSFSHDPRRSANAGLRASDGDRSVVQQVLTEAYADGRLDREEFDSRTAAAVGARTLGELPPLVSDLVAPDSGASPALVRPSDDDLQRQAV